MPAKAGIQTRPGVPGSQISRFADPTPRTDLIHPEFAHSRHSRPTPWTRVTVWMIIAQSSHPGFPFSHIRGKQHVPTCFIPTAALVGITLAVSAFGALAEPPWKVLPPMPELPPATVSGPVHVNDIDMWRAEFGPRDGKPVIMVHGGLSNSNYFGAVIPFLVSEGFHVIAVDSRGHGRSTRSAQPYSYELMASDVVAMLDALHIPKAD